MTDDEAIDKLGGTNKVAELFDVTPGAVTHWRYDGIPLARRFKFKKALEAGGITVPVDFVERAAQ